jgi:hypothetical protein
MDKPKKHIMASLLLDSRLYQALPKKARTSFLHKLSVSYPSLFHYQEDEREVGIVVGYEAAWAGDRKQSK